MTGLAALVVVLPLLAAAAGLVPARLLGGNAERRPVRALSAVTALLGTGLATVVAVPVWLLAVADPVRVHQAYVLLTPTGLLNVYAGVRVDGLAAGVMLLVCVVALAVQVYSVGFLRKSPRYRSYAAFVSLFTGAMLLVVLSADLLVLLVGWEVMGVCSYVLIGYRWERPESSRAAVKAFLVTRLGDVPFAIGIFALGTISNSFRLDVVLAAAPTMPHLNLYVGTLLLLGGVIGKSAQVPLQGWLPDAMAGPAPVSALIHAATMVAAGAYVVARLHPVFALSPPALAVLALVAAATMAGAALVALAQDDLKRLLAYSTISQVACMLAALAAGGDRGYTAGVAHLLTHGVAKALLFLCAGIIMARLGTSLLSQLGGAYRLLPVTSVVFALGWASLAGLPPTSGFVTKDAVLDVVWEQAIAPAPVLPRPIVLLVAVAAFATTFLTAAYATRALLLTCAGPPRSHQEPEHVERGLVWPAVALGVPTALLGIPAVFAPLLPRWVSAAGTGVPQALIPSSFTGAVSLGLVGLGAGVTYLAWRPLPFRDPVRLLGPRPLRTFVARGFLLDAVYDRLVVRVVARLARVTVRVDDDGLGGFTRDGVRLVRRAGGAVRRLQTGNAQLYVTGVAAAAVLAVVAAVVIAR